MVGKMQRYGRDFLKDLLSPLIKQWGRDEVLRAIYDMEQSKDSRDAEGKGSLSARHDSIVGRRHREPAAKPNAVMIAQAADVPPEKRVLLISLASQFEHKSFLPTISDVRNFLEMRGQDAASVKQRSDAFRKVIRAVMDMPNENIERMIRSSRHSGPSQLGPLSDAIKAASVAVRSTTTGANSFTDEASGEPSEFLQRSLPSKEGEKEDAAVKDDVSLRPDGVDIPYSKVEDSNENLAKGRDTSKSDDDKDSNKKYLKRPKSH